MALTSAQRVANYRARRKEAGLPDWTRANRREERKRWKKLNVKARTRPFIGCDGEGCGLDELGRQEYRLFRMGDRELFDDNRHLRTEELLDFICDAPADAILVGFAFGYDVTMILRDLPEKQQRRLFEPKVFGEGKSPFVWFKNFDIDYLPKNYLKVRRVRTIRDDDGKERRESIKGSTRIIYETFGFFQKSFVKILADFGVASDEDLQRIAANKDRRSAFATITPEERAYCALECDYLSKLMDRLRDYCREADIIPRTWSGAGKLATSLLGSHGTVKRKEVEEVTPPEVLTMAAMAYYGGRFEISRVGQLKGNVHEYDIRSAYPAAMQGLPCMVHGRWRQMDPGDLRSPGSLYLAHLSFRHSGRRGADHRAAFGGFPIRSKEGHLYWPLEGNGTYWSSEISSARRLGFEVKLKSGWQYETDCHCTSFDWVGGLFDYRRSIGSQGPGYPIKLGLNSLYGKLAQRQGNGVFANLVWAGMVTAATRAKLNDALAEAEPGSVCMLATDALYSTAPIPSLEIGEGLGQWEHAILPGLFIVQPGLYWSPGLKKRKSRGLSGKFFEEPGRTESFETAWEWFRQAENSNLEVPFPSVPVPVPGFIGLKLALARNKPELAGRWVSEHRAISFDYRNKRCKHTWEGECIVTEPKLGGRLCTSLPHREFVASGGEEPWEAARLIMEEQPDWIDLGPPWKD